MTPYLRTFGFFTNAAKANDFTSSEQGEIGATGTKVNSSLIYMFLIVFNESDCNHIVLVDIQTLRVQLGHRAGKELMVRR